RAARGGGRRRVPGGTPRGFGCAVAPPVVFVDSPARGFDRRTGVFALRTHAMLERERKSIEAEPKPGSRILASGTRPYTRPGRHLERLSVTMQPLPPRQQEVLRLDRKSAA